jgi:hypothetical protein
MTVFKAVVGIAAPPRIRPEYEETGGDNGPVVDEIPPGPEMAIGRQDTVHFDMDLRNGALMGLDFKLPDG